MWIKWSRNHFFHWNDSGQSCNTMQPGRTVVLDWGLTLYEWGWSFAVTATCQPYSVPFYHLWSVTTHLRLRLLSFNFIYHLVVHLHCPDSVIIHSHNIVQLYVCYTLSTTAIFRHLKWDGNKKVANCNFSVPTLTFFSKNYYILHFRFTIDFKFVIF